MAHPVLTSALALLRAALLVRGVQVRGPQHDEVEHSYSANYQLLGATSPEQSATQFLELQENDLLPMCSKNNTPVACFDIMTCPAGASKRPAITFAFDFAIPWLYTDKRNSLLAEKAKQVGADLVLMIPMNNATDDTKAQRSPMTIEFKSQLEVYFKIVEVPWITPPNLSSGVPRYNGCCGSREFMKFHALGLEEYDAIVNLDNDVHIKGSLTMLTRIFDCAASGKILTGRGKSSQVNGGFFAIRPRKTVLQDIILDLTTAQVTNGKAGWNGYGWPPVHKNNDFRVQGYLYYFFYQRGHPLVEAEQVDTCKVVLPDFCPVIPCSQTVFTHKGICSS